MGREVLSLLGFADMIEMRRLFGLVDSRKAGGICYKEFMDMINLTGTKDARLNTLMLMLQVRRLEEQQKLLRPDNCEYAAPCLNTSLEKASVSINSFGMASRNMASMDLASMFCDPPSMLQGLPVGERSSELPHSTTDQFPHNAMDAVLEPKVSVDIALVRQLVDNQVAELTRWFETMAAKQLAWRSDLLRTVQSTAAFQDNVASGIDEPSNERTVLPPIATEIKDRGGLSFCLSLSQCSTSNDDELFGEITF